MSGYFAVHYYRRVTKPRITWMDSARGLAILLVVFYHVVSALVDNGISVPHELVYFNRALAPLRIPALIFLSGLLLPRALGKSGLEYFSGKARFVLYPYLVWTALTAANDARILHDPEWAHRIGKSLLTAPFHTWFLAVLLGLYVVAWFVRSVSRTVLVAVSVAANLVVPEASPMILQEFAFLAGFFFLGCACAEHADSFERFLASRAAKAVALVGFVALAVFAVGGVGQLFSYDVKMIGWCAAAIIGTVLSVRFLDQRLGALLSPLRYVGRNSLRYYVMHFPLLPIFTMLLIHDGGMTHGTRLIALMGLGILVMITAVSLLADRIKVFELLFAVPELWRHDRTAGSKSAPSESSAELERAPTAPR
ncbi:MAG: acyltransferase [Comamonadaceae bacterium]|nr:MAG: acyltransferase [Comamonadaceae bacterium]